MNGLYSVITDSTCKGGGWLGGVSKGVPIFFLCRLKNMLKYAHQGGGV